MCSQGLPLSGGAPRPEWSIDMCVKPSGASEVKLKRGSDKVLVRVDVRGVWSTRVERGGSVVLRVSDSPTTTKKKLSFDLVRCVMRAADVLKAAGVSGGRQHAKVVARSVVGK